MKRHKSQISAEVITKGRWGLWEDEIGRGKRVRFSYSDVMYDYAHDDLYALVKRKRPDLFFLDSWTQHGCYHCPEVAQTNRGKNGSVKDFLEQHIVGN